jgi:hypothetical protein
MRYSSRFFLYAPFAGLLLLAAIAMTNWWIKATALAAHLDAINGHEIMPGVRLNFSQKRLAGFPFRIDTILKNLRIELAEVGGPVVWTSEDFAMHTLTYGRVQAILEAAGRQTLSWHDASGSPHSFAFLPGTFRASALLQRGKLIRFDSEIVDLDGAEFRAARAQLHMRTRGDDNIDVYLTFNGAHADSGYMAGLGSGVTQLIADTTLTHARTLAPVLHAEQSLQGALDSWRQAGQLAVQNLLVARSKQTWRYSGQLSLDNTHDLSGTLRTRDGTTLHFNSNHIARLNVLP